MSLREALAPIIDKATEKFTGSKEKYQSDQKEQSTTVSWTKLIVFFILLLIIGFIGKILWNEFLAGASGGKGFFTIVKPLPTLFHAIAIYVTLDLFRP